MSYLDWALVIASILGVIAVTITAWPKGDL